MKNANLSLIFTVFFTLSANLALASNYSNHHQHHGPDFHAPIGVMRDHTHAKGEFMLSYRYQLMKKSGLVDGASNVSQSEALDQYMMAPKSMEMTMHMIGAMYGVTNNLTVTAMSNIIDKKMLVSNQNDQKLNRRVDDIGDSQIGAMYKFFENGKNHAQFNLNLSLPTGDIKTDYNGQRLPYGMRLGSGSYELHPGFSYSGYKKNYSYGAQFNGIIRLNHNNLGYKLGNGYNVTSWVAKKLNNFISISTRLKYSFSQKISGYDNELNNRNPANLTQNSGGRKLDLLFGSNFIFSNKYLKGHRLGIEGGFTPYQRLNGLQLKNDFQFMIGWQRSF